MKIKVLWIEDASNKGLAYCYGPINLSGKYIVESVQDVSAAIEKLSDNEYDVVIVDIRMLPGTNPEWDKLYSRFGEDPRMARLGWHLLETLFKTSLARVKMEEIPKWVSPDRFAVFTVETNLEENLNALGISVYTIKGAVNEKSRLLETIEKVLENQ